ncbi:hypothetical protein [Neorhodopirellula pilleata]|uniref:Uncharacterized protein n=1 Tax=Neorhodopirellula pilleata TaxID=2714738 RepID=A0A5C6AUZ0_9BACT|nr:hypothetical protein [Neorhodopirellula pilleata]TWU03550.1 hypothetical protein Pla100_04770 [Neorhodopirellula pilleata]
MSSIKPLSHAALKHWGLIASPFRADDPMSVSRSDCAPSTQADFYFRSPPHARLMSWLRSELIQLENRAFEKPSEPRVLLLRSQIGSGASTAVRQFSDTRGIDRVALETRMIKWGNETVEQIGSELVTDLKCDDALLFVYVHAFRLSQAQAFQRWVTRQSSSVGSFVVLFRIEDHAGSPHVDRWLPSFRLPSFRLTRTDPRDMVRCVRLALHHAGATAPILTKPAITALVRMTDGSYRDLAAQTHSVLSWSHAHRFDVIGERVIAQYRAYFQKPIEARSRRAA